MTLGRLARVLVSPPPADRLARRLVQLLVGLVLYGVSDALLVLIAVTAGCRLDMHTQPYYRTMAKSDFFPDGRSARLPVDSAPTPST